jgi:hypothetical protein
VTDDGRGGFWVANVWEYRLYRVDAQGALTDTLVRDAPWFPKGGEYVEGMPTEIRPPPAVRALARVPGSDDIVVQLLVPDEAWVPGIPLAPSLDWGRRVFDSVFEVISPEEGRVLATGRHEDWLGMVCGSASFHAIVENQDLSLSAVVYDLFVDSVSLADFVLPTPRPDSPAPAPGAPE